MSEKAQFKHLLMQMHIDDLEDLEIKYPYLEQGELKKVRVHTQSRLWEFELYFQDILPVEVYQQFFDRLTLAFQNIAKVSLSITTSQGQVSAELLRSYWPLALKMAGSPYPILCKATGQALPELQEDGRVRIATVEDKFTACLNETYLRPVEDAYTRFGFPRLTIEAYTNVNGTEDNAFYTMQQEQEAVMQEQAKRAIEKKQAFEQRKVSDPKPSQDRYTNNSRRSKQEMPKDVSPMPLNTLTEADNRVMVEGFVFFTEMKELRNKSIIVTLKITDYTSSIVVKKFVRGKLEDDPIASVKKGQWIRVYGSVRYDDFIRDVALTPLNMEVVTHEGRKDTSEEKRVELHAHTTMSMMDATNSVEEIIGRAAEFGHPAVAITDHAGVQAFPDAYHAGQKNGIKVLFGVEANVVDDAVPIAYNEAHVDLAEATYVVFDVETTGLSAIYNRIIELSGVKMHKGNIIDTFEAFINPGESLSETIVRLTGITDEMLKDAKSEKEVIADFMAFSEGCILVAHNASFDMGFLNTALARYDWPKASNPVIDTLEMSRMLHPDMKNHKLNTLAKKYDVSLEHHHRAIDDSEATGHLSWIFVKEAAENFDIHYHDELNQYTIRENAYKQARPFHATIIAQTQEGLKNLFKLISLSNVKYFERVPRIPRSELNRLRKGLIIGSACSNGEVFEAAMQKGKEEAMRRAEYYDYLEIMPKAVYQPLINQELVSDDAELEDITRTLVEIGDTLNIPVVATGDVHYLDPSDWIYRKILINSMGGSNILNRTELPEVHFRTTEEMLDAFAFLGEEKAHEVVIENTQKIADMCEDVVPVKDKLYTPHMDGVEDELRQLSYDKAHEIYGNDLPDIVEKRLEKELKSIIGNGFAVIYIIAQKLVHKSLSDGYLVGSRGSVGSSFVATMSGITEVNPLCPHYVCPNCKHSEFFDHGEYGSGYDMPEKDCPECGTPMHKDGQDIPFETFLGFHGDKVPDIDLNFSGSYQPEAHNFTKVMFGEDHAFRAGTIQTVADKTAYGFVKGYERDKNITYRGAEEDRLALGVSGAKRTTGQHPGGIIVIPENMDVYDFTPIQYPADDQNADWYTTHFDFHKIHDNVLKLDILGHDDPTVIRMLQDLSGIDPKSIPPDDPDVMKLFTGTDVLGVTPEQIYSKTGTLGIPEFGTKFVRGMLEQTRPTTFAELLQISGLSHGTDVWLGNASDLIEKGIAKLSDCIGCRDDIMVYLIHHGLEDGLAFKIMESVRKGKGIPDDWQEEMRSHDVPEWYIDSCLKIKYMFPKAHAAAYVLMALRVAYFKVHFPILYYCAYFSVRAQDFDLEAMCAGKEATKKAIENIREKGDDATKKERDVLGELEMANEMLERGFKFGMVDLYRSDAENFVIDGDTLIAPFRAINGLGTNVAKMIVAAREEGEFLSKEDLATRGKVSKTLIGYMDSQHILDGLPDENQLSLFDEF